MRTGRPLMRQTHTPSNIYYWLPGATQFYIPQRQRTMDYNYLLFHLHKSHLECTMTCHPHSCLTVGIAPESHADGSHIRAETIKTSQTGLEPNKFVMSSTTTTLRRTGSSALCQASYILLSPSSSSPSRLATRQSRLPVGDATGKRRGDLISTPLQPAYIRSTTNLTTLTRHATINSQKAGGP